MHLIVAEKKKIATHNYFLVPIAPQNSLLELELSTVSFCDRKTLASDVVAHF